MSSRSILGLPPYATTSPSRLQALYSDISRQKQSNPASYHSSIEWWRKALEVIVGSGLQHGGGRLVLNADRTLIEGVKVDGVGKPLALGAVVTELRTNKSLVLRSDFLNAKVSIYDPGWLPARIVAFVVGKPLWWALEQMGVVGEEGLLGSTSASKDTGWWGDYVVVSLVEKAADEVLRRQRGKVGGAGDMLYDLEGFMKEYGSVLETGSVMMESGDAGVLLKFLERERGAVVVDKEVIKFVAENSTEGREITAVDRGILELKSAVGDLHAQVAGVQQKIDECTRKASNSLRQKRKSVALSYIRSRRQLEDLLSKRLGSLDTLESTLIRVEAAVGDVEIMKSYESSTVTLRAILAHPSLQSESIDKTMDALAEANADARDVDEAVRLGGDVALGVDIDEADLEDELSALIREAEGEKESTVLKDRLGAVHAPASVPGLAEGSREKMAEERRAVAS